MSVKHTKVSPKADSADSTLVRPSDWNAEHTVSGLVTDAGLAAQKLDDHAAPDDNTDNDATIAKHGLLPKLNNVATDFLNGQGGWSAGTSLWEVDGTETQLKTADEIDMQSKKIINLTDPAAAQDAATKKYHDDNTISDSQGRVEIAPFAYSSIGQGTFSFWIQDINIPFAYVFRNTSTADGDNISYDIYLDAGTYTLRILHMRYGSAGILDVDIDGVEVASFDLYRATYAVTLSTETSISIATAGRKTLRLRIDGKHADSSDYAMYIIWISLWRTA